MTLEDFIKTMKEFEGGLSRDMNDSASAHMCPTAYKDGHKYHTQKGITYAAWSSHFGTTHDDRFYTMNDQDWFEIFKLGYWIPSGCDKLTSLNVAAMIADSSWGSGVSQGIKTLQKALNLCGHSLVVDGAIGPKTIEAANSTDELVLFECIVSVRRDFFKAIGVGKNAKFLNGWLRRLSTNELKYKPIHKN